MIVWLFFILFNARLHWWLQTEYLRATARSGFLVYPWDLGIYIHKEYSSLVFLSAFTSLGMTLTLRPCLRLELDSVFVLVTFQTEVESGILQHSLPIVVSLPSGLHFITTILLFFKLPGPWPHTSFHDSENNSFSRPHYLAFLFQHCLTKIYIYIYFYTPICFHFYISLWLPCVCSWGVIEMQTQI